MIILQRVNKIRISGNGYGYGNGNGNRENNVFDSKRKANSVNRIKDPKYYWNKGILDRYINIELIFLNFYFSLF